MNKIILLLAFLFLISLISAQVYKETFNTNSKYGSYEIKDCQGFWKGLECYLGFDIININTVAEYRLDNFDSSVIDCTASGTVKLYQLNKLFSGIEFEDINKNVKLLSDVKFYLIIEQPYNETVYEYDNQCIDIQIIDNQTLKNITKKQCIDIILNSYNVTKYKTVLQEYDYSIMPVGEYKWLLKAKRNVNEPIDFILINGVSGSRLEEWAWWNSNWLKRIEINITGASEPLVNFTVLLNITYNNNMTSDFRDIRFVNGSCSGTQTDELSYEIDYYNNNTNAYVWVRIPALNVNNNIICMYYNNSAAVDSSSVNAWDSNYKGVWHFSNKTGTTWRESTSNQNNATDGAGTPPVLTNCLIGRCANFSGTQGLNVSDSASLSLDNNNITFEAIIYKDVSVNAEKTIIGRAVANSYWWETRITTNLLALNKVAVGTVQAGTISNNIWYTIQTIQTNGVVYNYINTSYQGTGNLASFSDTSGNIGIGWDTTSTAFFSGRIDELRLSNVKRSSAWLNRTYNNLNMSNVIYYSEETNVIVYPNLSYNPSSTNTGYVNNNQVLLNITVYNFTVVNYTFNDLNYSFTNNLTNIFWTTLNLTLDSNHTIKSYAYNGDIYNETSMRWFYYLANGTIEVNITYLPNTGAPLTIFDLNYTIKCLTHNCRDSNYTIIKTPAGCTLSSGVETNLTLGNLSINEQLNYSNVYSCAAAGTFNFTLIGGSKYSVNSITDSITVASSSGGAYTCDIRSSASRRDADTVIVTVAVLGANGEPEDHDLVSDCTSSDPDEGALPDLSLSNIGIGKYYSEYTNVGSGFCYIQELDDTCGFNKVIWNSGYIDNSTINIPASQTITGMTCEEVILFGYNDLENKRLVCTVNG